MAGAKLKSSFITVLGIISIIGFSSIFLDAWDLFTLEPYMTSLIMIIVGIGLLLEGGIKNMIKYYSGGLSNTELTHIVTIVVGGLAIFVGFTNIPGLTFISPVGEAIKGLVALIAIIVITIQTWAVK